MIALYIIGSILLILGILLVIPIVIETSYNGDGGIFLIKYLFFKIYDSSAPRKSKKKKRKSKEQSDNTEFSSKKKKKGPFSDMISEKGIWGTAEFFHSVIGIIIEFAGSAIKRVRISEFYADVKVCGKDAAETAINYGKICSFFYPACSLILGKFRHNNKKVTASAYPDFDSEKSVVDVLIKFRVAALWILLHGLRSGLKFLISHVKKSINDKTKSDFN